MKAATKKTSTTRATPAAGLCPPWTELARKLEALFRQDPDVTVAADLDGDAKRIRILVQSADKASALSRLLPAAVELGAVRVALEVVPADGVELSARELLERAFAGNDAFRYAAESAPGPGAPPFTYAVFEPQVLQYQADSIGHPRGLRTTLAENVFREIFTGPEASAILPCTGEADAPF